MLDAGLSRRTLIGHAIASAAAVSAPELFAARKRLPNFILILADDMGAFDLSCYGRPDYSTPHIDSLARDGMKFEFGYANSSSCAPTRTALMSGRYQNRLPVGTGIGGGYPSKTIGFPSDAPSLTRTLKRGGYRTCLIGKWDLGELPAFGPIKSGYDEFFGFMGGAIDYWSHDFGGFSRDAERHPDLYENEKAVQVEGYSTDLFSNRACDFITRNASQPFLLSLHYSAPHWPWQTRTDRGQPRFGDGHYDGGSPAIYADMVKAMDDGVGRVLGRLRELRLEEDTVVIFTSDNGGERFSKMWPLRGGKNDLWEGGTRVPLIARWLGHIKPGSVSAQVALSMDFLPTFAALANIRTDIAASFDGIDLSPQLLGAPPVERLIFWKTPRDMLSALAYPWKYLQLGQREFLYNISEDPTEHANYKLRQPEIFARLKNKAQAWSDTMLNSMPAAPPSFEEGLEALDPNKD